MRPSTSDKRVREVYVTTAGLAAFRAALKLLTPDTRLIFSEWRKNDIAALHDLLEKLKTWLDENRELRPVV
jgi:DNA-binding MarR family transcriptional regulator